jgi:hypothetical protein
MDRTRPDAYRSGDSTRGLRRCGLGCLKAVLHGLRLGADSLSLTLIAAGHTCRAEHFLIARYPQQER